MNDGEAGKTSRFPGFSIPSFQLQLNSTQTASRTCGIPEPAARYSAWKPEVSLENSWSNRQIWHPKKSCMSSSWQNYAPPFRTFYFFSLFWWTQICLSPGSSLQHWPAPTFEPPGLWGLANASGEGKRMEPIYPAVTQSNSGIFTMFSLNVVKFSCKHFNWNQKRIQLAPFPHNMIEKGPELKENYLKSETSSQLLHLTRFLVLEWYVLLKV